MSRKVVIVAHGGRPQALEALRETVRELEAAGFEAVLHDDDLAETFGDPIDVIREREGVVDAELVLVLGGDGTILRAAELTHGTKVPLLGVNLGHVGFLAETDRSDLRRVVARLASGEYTVQERGVLDVAVDVPGRTGPLSGWALNEVTVAKTDPARMIDVALEVDGRPFSSFGCDGVVLATATGSTAYAFSAGGPIVWPDVEAMLMVPLAAHALFSRAVVVGPTSRLAIDILESASSEGLVTCDGRRTMRLPRGSRVEVRRGPSPIRLARLDDEPFTDRLVDKFDLPVVGWRQRAAKEG